MILFIQHIDIEGPGTLGDFLKDQGISFKICDLSHGDRLPFAGHSFSAVVSLGGPMNVYEEDAYSFLKDENIFLQQIIRQGIPFLGICLGAQLLAKAAGAKVAKSPVREVGWFQVDVNSDGVKDPLLKGLSGPLSVFQWHEDTFTIPAQGKLLATGSGCHNQAFRVGRCAYGFQFHLEVTEPMITQWCQAYFKGEETLNSRRREDLIQGFRDEQQVRRAQTQMVYSNFLKLISGST